MRTSGTPVLAKLVPLFLFLQISPSRPQEPWLAPAGSRGDRLAREIHEKGGYPSFLPRGKERGPLGGRKPGDLPPSVPLERRGGGRGILPADTPLGALLAALLGGGLLVILAFLLLGGRGRPEGKGAESGEREGGAAQGGSGPFPGDPEELARRELFGQAISALLLRGLREAGWSPEGRGKSLTAREVVGGLPREDPRRSGLAGLLTLAEKVRFAGLAATEAHYREACRWFRALEEGGGLGEEP